MSISTIGSHDHFINVCDLLADQDHDLKSVIQRFGYPPLWSRPNSYESLVHIILEQQVSLASAKAALDTLIIRTGGITPESILAINPDEFRALTISRQKTRYISELAENIVNGSLDLKQLEGISDHEVRTRLIQQKGIGNWTIDIYLMMVLGRIDIFPTGDLAAITAVRRLKSKQLITQTPDMIIESWAPYRTVATMIVWHYYLSRTRT